ncbi:tRNA pseudouridine(38-40) synthase TruA [Mariprofundus ferrooxydans]|nr:tRNA pseudouridine(38-40) synthase TruA [Mariprofundus ferrooxydans]
MNALELGDLNVNGLKVNNLRLDDQQTQRIAMVLEFDGRPFHGWQQQNNASSVQASLQHALQRIEGRFISATAAGRTDAGVHAEAMLVHADVSLERWQRSHLAYVHGCNSFLPDQIRVVGVRAVKADFHARFDCRGRSYRYQIWNRNTASALQRWKHWWMPKGLDIALMREAGMYCLGKQDFSALRAAGCQASSATRCIRTLSIEQHGCCISIDVAADAFLYHMVRNLVGNLVDVGRGQSDPDAFSRLLEGKDRSRGAATAPAHGLYFMDACYDAFNSRSLIGLFE